MEYKVSGQTTASNPSNGNMKFNTASQSDATELYFSNLSVGNIDCSNTWRNLIPGENLSFQLKTDTSVLANFTVNAVTDNTGWFTIDVTPGSSTGFPVPGGSSVLIEPVDQPSTVTGFEYYIEEFIPPTNSDTQQVAQDRLNELGAEGWEVMWITNFRIDDMVIRIWFKREL